MAKKTPKIKQQEPEKKKKKKKKGKRGKNTDGCISKHAHTRTCIHTYVRAYIHRHIYVYYTHIYAHICMKDHMHMYRQDKPHPTHLVLLLFYFFGGKIAHYSLRVFYYCSFLSFSPP
mmetsp:Transcript_10410/g.20387  ORF Transcript_10410/g.20387 Transcript_10410/m.20387 type:complete len:117 (-) Transcript_10410:348-698(-)